MIGSQTFNPNGWIVMTTATAQTTKVPKQKTSQTHCRRCNGAPDDQSLIRGKPTIGTKSSITITLCRSCHDAATELLLSHPEAPYAALKYCGVSTHHPDYDDFVQQLNAVYWRCCVDFEESRGWKFSTYILKSLRDAIKTIIRTSCRHGFSRIGKGKELLTRPMSFDASLDDGETLSDLVASDSEPPDKLLATVELQEIVQDALDSISPRYALVIRMRFLDDDKMTLKDVGEFLGVTRERVRQIERLALRELREVLERNAELSESRL